MADWLRRLLYPLVLPVIVGSVWFCGWVRQQDDRAAEGRWQCAPLPPLVTAGNPTAPAEDKPAVRTEYLSTTTDADDAADDR